MVAGPFLYIGSFFPFSRFLFANFYGMYMGGSLILWMILQGFSLTYWNSVTTYRVTTVHSNLSPKYANMYCTPTTVITHRRTVIKASTVQTEMQHLFILNIRKSFHTQCQDLENTLSHSIYQVTRSRVSGALILKPNPP